MRSACEEDPGIARPHLPPLLVGGLAVWLSAAVAWPLLGEASSFARPAVAFAGAALGLSSVTWCLRRRAVPLLCVVALCVGGALVSCGLHAAFLGTASENKTGPWVCVLQENAKKGEFGWSARAEATNGEGCRVAVRLNMEEEGLLRGDCVTVRGSIREPSDGSRAYYWDRGLAGSLSAPEGVDASKASGVPALRRRALGLIEEHGGDQGPLVAALVCGYRVPIEESGAYEQFKATGLAHLVAVSGAHLSIVTMFVAAGLRLVGLGRRAIAVATALFLAGYVLFTGVPVSALRAAVMAATGLIGLVAERRQSALAALGLCLVAFIVLDPPCALSASFALSAGSTLGIVVFARYLAGAFGPARSSLRRFAGDPLSLTASSALATQPYAAALFSQLPLLSPLANLLGAPLFTLACVTGFVCVVGSCLVDEAAPLLMGAASLAAAPLSVIVSLLAAVPGACLPVDAEPAAAATLSVALCTGLWAWWPRLRPRVILSAAAATVAITGVFALGVAAPADDEIVMLDVGQGDAFLVRSGGCAVLVDTGNQDALLREACAREGIRHLDAVTVTHHDDDHCGSLDTLGDVAVVDRLLVAADLLTCDCDSCGEVREGAEAEGYPGGVVGLGAGDEIRCGRFALTVLAPERFVDGGGNADSLILLCRWDGDGDGAEDWSALFCGDAEAEQLRAVEEFLPEEGVDVLKVGHHGSRAALDETLVERLSPSIALIGVGENNRYGHPTTEALELLGSAGCAVFRSDERGDVAVGFSMEKLTVAPQREAPEP